MRGALMLGSITASGQQDLSRLERAWGESSPRPVEYEPWSWRMMPVRVDFGAKCAFSGWNLVRGVWCADFGADFGARCVVFGLAFGVRCAVFRVDFGARCTVFGLEFGARCVVRRFWGRFRCTVRRFWARFWCAVRRFCARLCVVRRFWGRFRCTVRRFWARFWCAVRRFWAGFWCAVCGAPILGPISVHGASFLGSLLWCAVVRRFWARFRCTVRFLGLILARCAPFFGIDFGAWCADVGVDHSQRATKSNYQDWRGPGGNRARDLSNMGPWSRRMMPFRVDFGARCAFSGWVLVCGASFLGSILVRGVWCADFGADFGARCALLGSFLVCGAPFLGSILVRGVWCAAFGAVLGSILVLLPFGFDFGASCAHVGADFGARCAFLNWLWILALVLVHGAFFLLGLLLVHGM